MAVVFVLLFNPAVTTLTFHELASLVLGLAMIIHVVINWKWVISVSKRIFSKRKTRLSYVLNIALLLDMLVIIISGLLISEILFPNFRYFINVNWLPIHVVSSFIGLLTIGIHIGLHWNWILQKGKQSPKILKLVSFRKPSHKKVAKILLILGTIALLAQMPKQVVQTQAIFSDQPLLQESRGGYEQRFTDSGEEFGDFSIIILLGIIPVFILYSSMLGSTAYYTHMLEKRFIIKRKLKNQCFTLSSSNDRI